MDKPADAPAPLTSLERIQIPEVVVFDTIVKEIGPSIDSALKKAAALAAAITDDASRDLAIAAAERVRDDALKPMEKWREELYVAAWYRPGEEVREVFDTRIKPAKTVIKTIMGHVSDYNLLKERQEKLAREKAEAEARRLREDAERKQKEAEEAERRRQEAEAAEKRRQQEAQAAEERRVKAEAEAKERREREAREAAAAETKRKLDEEEDARLRHAQEAQDQGNGATKADAILESATPISPVLARATSHQDAETLRLEQEQAQRVADEKAQLEREAAAAADLRLKEAEADAARKRREADDAVAAATSAAAAAATTSIATQEESRTFGVDRYVWDLESDGTEKGDEDAVYSLLEAIVMTRKSPYPIPLAYIGYNPKRPQDFRPPKIGEDVTEKRDRFSCPGIKVYIQRDERFKPVRKVGGRR